MHDGARPPDSRIYVVRIPEHDLLDLVDEPRALGRVEGSRLPCEEIVDPGIGDPCLVAAMFSPGIIARDALFSSEKIDETETRRCSFAAQVEEDNPCVLRIRRNGFMSKLTDVLGRRCVSPESVFL